MRISEKLEKIENNLIKYKAETFSTADTSPLYRTSIRFEPFGNEYITRYYRIQLLFDAENPIVESSSSYLQPVIPNYGVPTAWQQDINLQDSKIVVARQAGNFTLIVTIYSSAEVKGYNVSYEDRSY